MEFEAEDSPDDAGPFFDPEILEEQIRARLVEFTGGRSRGYETRVFRAGRFRLRIHARYRLTRRQLGCYYTPDQLAHRLSLLGAESEDLLRGVKELLLIPELALSDRHLLTHLYLPERRLLALYLYPRRFDSGDAPVANPRLSVAPAPRSRLGLLGHVLASTNPDLGLQGLRKYLVPATLLAHEETREMQQTHDLYSGFSP